MTNHEIKVMYRRIKNFTKLKQKKILFPALGVLLMWYVFSFDMSFFRPPTSTVLLAKNGELLGAKIAADGQWRFPHNDTIPELFEKAIVEFEDRHFYYHPGVNPFSLGRALIQNIKSKKVASGGSTLSMQVIRLYRGKQKRTIFEKIIEVFMAVRMEIFLSKKEILSFYASNAPFGGNVVGLDAASWRYFGRRADQLSIAETATLAVLPNAPGLIFPGKNQEKLLNKRNRLIDKLFKSGEIDSLSCELAKLEPLPDKPRKLPMKAPHFLQLAHEYDIGKNYNSHIDFDLQNLAEEIVMRHIKVLNENEIHNAAVQVFDIANQRTLIYLGNVTASPSDHAGNVDIIRSRRSSGSILKPLLYALMLNEGELLPNTLLPDVPTQISGYRPQNNSLGYDGAVTAQRALARSLNVPAVKMLQQYGIEKFHLNLQKLSFSTIKKEPSHYGLSLILGGAEVSLGDLVSAYGKMAYKLQYDYFGQHPDGNNSMDVPLSAASVYFTFNAMNEVARPDEEENWEQFTSNSKIAWKTGTSYGNRDAWAVGVTRNYVVGVWVGNATGEGRPGITGIGAAAPIMFDVFKLLKPSKWFDAPYDEMDKVAICGQSGYRASAICEPIDTTWMPISGLKTPPCPYHQLIHLDKSEAYRVNSDCYDPLQMVSKPWFVLPPAMEWYYKTKNPSYKVLPSFDPGCNVNGDIKSMEIIYPKDPLKIYVPIELDGSPGQTVFEAAHRIPKSSIYWHLDDEFMGSTETFHKMAFRPKEGKHTLTLVDQNGETIIQRFEIVGKKKSGY